MISISGHTHASILDERSISQTSYTAINTQSLSYTDFEEGALLEEPGDVEANPMCMIMEIADNQITIRRYSVLGGQEEKEPWVIPLPIDQTQFLIPIRRVRSGAKRPLGRRMQRPPSARKGNGSC